MLKVLIADDDDSVRLFLSIFLKNRFGCLVSEAVNGIEALEKIKTEKPDLVMSDIKMPEMSGVELIAKVRIEKEFAGLPFIMMTAMNDKEIIKNLIKLGITDYILKPINYETFYSRFETTLEKIKNSKSGK